MIVIKMIVIFAAAITLTYCLACLNRMTATTHHGIRASYILIAVGAFGEIAAILDGHEPGIAETMFICGCGLLDFVDRRAHVRRSLRKEEPEHANA